MEIWDPGTIEKLAIITTYPAPSKCDALSDGAELMFFSDCTAYFRMLILGLESSCDETGVAIYDTSKGLLADFLHSQIEMHREYGGVVPELASRDHIRRLIPLIRACMKEAGANLADLDLIAYTQGPGLGGALLTASSLASGLGLALQIPVMPIHHLEGHLLSPMLSGSRPQMPYVALLVSGGHTQLLHVRSMGEYELLGETVDDAAGEAFDKTASLLGLTYPGGPALSRLAATGNPARFDFPRPMLHSGDLNMSFSGLKTSVAVQLAKLGATTDAALKADVAASFQQAVVDVLAAKTQMAMEQTGSKTLVVAGGVGANEQLRSKLADKAGLYNWNLLFPPLNLCTDNGAMIALAAAFRVEHLSGIGDPPERGFSIRPRWPLQELHSKSQS